MIKLHYAFLRLYIGEFRIVWSQKQWRVWWNSFLFEKYEIEKRNETWIFAQTDNYSKAVKIDYFPDVKWREVGCHFVLPWRVTAFSNDVKWPTVWSMVNRCFHGKSKMVNHVHEKVLKLSETTDRSSVTGDGHFHTCSKPWRSGIS